MTNLKMITLHGERVAYRDEGAGEPLLLIHGMGGSSLSWRALVPLLATKYRVIAPDLLGHGQSEKPRGDYSLGAFAVWLRDLLNALDIKKVTVIGHSLGGGVAMQFAHQHKEYCQRLVLVSSGGLGTDVCRVLRMLSLPGAELVLPLIASRPAISAGNALRRVTSSGRDVSRFSETWMAHAALSDRRNRQAFLRTLRAVVDHRGQAVSALSRLHFNADMPALIISGDQDRTIPVAHAYEAHKALPLSRIHVIPGVWHHPQVERPDTVANLIDEFIAETSENAPRAGAGAGGSLNNGATSTSAHDGHVCGNHRTQPIPLARTQKSLQRRRPGPLNGRGWQFLGRPVPERPRITCCSGANTGVCCR